MDQKGLLNGLDLFSGIGGIGLGLRPWVRTVAYCEISRYCQGVLLSRMRSGDISEAPIWDDVRTLKGEMLPKIEIIYGGFPCQDISAAGAGAGLGGERSGLYLEIERLVREVKPTFVFLENVPAIRTRGLGRVVWGLSELGYDCRWTTISAAAVGAPHQRNRWFLLAHANGLRSNSRSESELASKKHSESELRRKTLANTIGLEKSWGPEAEPADPIADASWWVSEPNVGRVVDGLPFRVDRVRGLGNSVVPIQAREAFKKLVGF